VLKKYQLNVFKFLYIALYCSENLRVYYVLFETFSQKLLGVIFIISKDRSIFYKYLLLIITTLNCMNCIEVKFARMLNYSIQKNISGFKSNHIISGTQKNSAVLSNKIKVVRTRCHIVAIQLHNVIQHKCCFRNRLVRIQLFKNQLSFRLHFYWHPVIETRNDID